MKKASLVLLLIFMTGLAFAYSSPHEIQTTRENVNFSGFTAKTIKYVDVTSQNAFGLPNYPGSKSNTFYVLAENKQINGIIYFAGTPVIMQGSNLLFGTRFSNVNFYCTNQSNTIPWTRQYGRKIIKVSSNGKNITDVSGIWHYINTTSNRFYFKKYPNNPNVIEGPDFQVLTLVEAPDYSEFNGVSLNFHSTTPKYWSPNYYNTNPKKGVFFVNCSLIPAPPESEQTTGNTFGAIVGLLLVLGVVGWAYTKISKK